MKLAEMFANKEFRKNAARRFLAMLLVLISLGSTCVGSVSAYAEEGEEPDGKEGKVTSTFPTDYKLTEWMKHIPGYWQITQINLPGTHDAGTKLVDLAPYSKCQDWTIKEQLDNGIRFLDIRTNAEDEDKKPDAKSNPLVIVHNFCSCYADPNNLLYLEKDVLPVCEQFVKDHPSEFIVFKITDEHVDGKPWVQEYLQQNLIPRLLAKKDLYLIPEYDRLNQQRVTNTRAYTVSEARGHIVFLMDYTITKYEDHYNDTDCDHRIDYFLNHCLETSIPMNLSSNDYFRRQSYENQVHDGNPDVRLFGMNNNAIEYAVLTPISWFAWRINSWFEKQDLQQGIRYGWFFMDFPTEKQIDHIIRTNPNIIGDQIYWTVTKDGTLHLSSRPYSGDASNVTAHGDFDGGLRFRKAEDVFWYRYRSKITSVVVDQEIHPHSLSYWFSNLGACTSFDLANLETERVKTLDHMFLNCTAVKTLDLGMMSRDQLLKADEFDVTEMFANCTNLVTICTSINLSYTDVKKSKGMFRGDTKLVGEQGTKCDGSENLTQYAQVDGKNGKAGFFSENMPSKIYYGISDGTLYLSHHQDEKTPTSLARIKRPTWDGYGSSIQKVVVTEAIYPTYTLGWFQDFKQCTSFDLALMDLSKCLDMSEMFSGCSAVETLDLSGWARSKPCWEMFAGCSKLKTIYVDPGFSMSNQTGSKYIFKGCTSLVGQNGTKYDSAYDSRDYERAVIDGSGVGNIGYFTVRKSLYWGYDPNARILYLGGEPDARTPYEFVDQVYSFAPWYYNLPRDSDNHYWPKVDAVKVITPMSPVNTAHWFLDLCNTKVFDLTLLDTSKTVNMRGMFENLIFVEELNLSSFSSASLKEAREMFYQSRNLKTIYATKNFDLTSESINTMFLTNSNKLVGGLGTTDSSKPHLKIDEVGSPGVFTEAKAVSTLYWGVDRNGQLIIGDKTTPGVTDSFLDRPRTSAEDIPWSGERITSVLIGAAISPGYTDHWFDNSLGFYHITDFQLDNLDTSHTADMSRMFAGNKDCALLDLENFVQTRGSLKTVEMFAESGFETILVSTEFDLRCYITSLGTNMFRNCEKLVGGNGTAWNKTRITDNSYALYDGKGGNPGYFTLAKDLKYTVTFKNTDGTVLQSSKVPYKEMPEYKGPKPPTREPSDVYTYKFAGWDPVLTKVYGDQTYKADYDATPRVYTAKFYKSDVGVEVLDTLTFYYGEDIPTTDKIPVKAPSEGKKYVFLKWVPERWEGDTIHIRPVFEEQPLEYTVVFCDEDGETILDEHVDFYGNTPEYQYEPPTKESDGEYTYSFGGWNPKIHPIIDENNNYVAHYDRVPVQYKFTKGNGSEYVKGSGESFDLETDGAEKFLITENAILVDGTPVAAEYIEKIEGETYSFRFKADYLKNLSVGPHTVTAQFQNGSSPTANFSVRANPDPVGMNVPIRKVIANEEGQHVLIEGAVLQVEGVEINYKASWISRANKDEELILLEGDYILSELEAPYGYKKADPIHFRVKKVDEAGTLGLYLLEEADELPGGLTALSSIGPMNGPEEITPEDDGTGDDGTPEREGNELDDEIPIVDLTQIPLFAAGASGAGSGKETKVEFIEMMDEPLPKLTVSFFKKNEEGDCLADAAMTLDGIDVEFQEKWESTAEEENPYSVALLPGTYLLRETIAPVGYRIAPSIEFIITDDLKLQIVEPDGAPPAAQEKAEISMIDSFNHRDVRFSKIDEHGMMLAGAKLHVEGTNYRKEWITDTEEPVCLDLTEGEYTLVEDEAPKGYLLADNIRFRVRLDPVTNKLGIYRIEGEAEEETETSVESITMTDPEASKADVKFLKVNAESEKIFGAILEIWEQISDGETVREELCYSWMTLANEEEVVRLLPGDYKLKEAEAPAGYLRSNAIAFTVTDELKVVIGEETLAEATIVMLDEEIPKTDVLFIKTDDADPAKSLSGAILQVTGETINYSTSWETDAANPKTLSLLPGVYILHEYSAPRGYRSADDIHFRVDNNQTVWKLGTDEDGNPTEEQVINETLIMVDENAQKLKVSIVKTDGVTNIGGAQLRIDGVDNNFVDTWTTVAGKDHELELNAGTYELSEDEAPYGYRKADPIRFRVKENDTELQLLDITGETDIDAGRIVDKIEMMDVSIPRQDVKFSIEDESGSKIGGARLQVKGDNGSYLQSWTSTANKEQTLNLAEGIYRMEELLSPAGYLPCGDIEFKVADGKLFELYDGGEKEVDRIVMKTTMLPFVWTEFSLVDEYGIALPGASLRVKGENVDFDETWTSSTEPRGYSLSVGSYRMIEETAPAGYRKANDILFAVKPGGTIVVLNRDGTEQKVGSVVMVNQPIPGPFNVTFSLRDGSGNKLGGGGLKVQGTDSSYESEWISVKGSDKELTLSPGSYTMKELLVPVGYTGSADIAFQVKDDGTVVTVSGSTETPVSAVVMTNAKKTDPEPTVYHIIQGANSSWTHGSGITHRFASDAPFSKFVGVKIDGVTVAAANYTAFEGSTVIDLKPAYLDTLAIGTHRIEIVSSDGSASTNFTIRSGFVPPVTGDAGTTLWITMMACSACTAAVVCCTGRKKNKIDA